MMEISQNGLTLLKSLENEENIGLKGDKYFPYKDDLETWNIGWGHKIPNTYEVHFYQGLTITQTEYLLLADIDPIEKVLNNKIVDYISQQDASLNIKQLNQNQFDALIIFIYNIGISAFVNSHVYGFIREGYEGNACTYWAEWCHDRNPITHQEIICDGLVKRRKIEINLFNS